MIRKNENLNVIDVNTALKGNNTQCIDAFTQKYQTTKTLLIGEGGISVEEFLLSQLETWM